MSFNFHIEGNQELKALLEQGITKPAEKSVLNISSLIRNEAKKNLQASVYSRKVPWKRTGDLKRSVTSTKLNNLAYQVEVGKYYGIFIEKGTKAHTIYPKSGRFLRWTSGGVKRFARKVNHPGTLAYPFFAPAIEKATNQAQSIIQKNIQDFLNKPN